MTDNALAEIQTVPVVEALKNRFNSGKRNERRNFAMLLSVLRVTGFQNMTLRIYLVHTEEVWEKVNKRNF